jgi:hypothetical protein
MTQQDKQRRGRAENVDPSVRQGEELLPKHKVEI